MTRTLPRTILCSTVAVLALSVTALSATALAGTVPTTDSTLPHEPRVGARLFEQLSCSGCHDVGDAPTEHLGPRLGHMNARTSFYDAFARMWNAAPTMHQTMEEHHVLWPVGTADQIVDLVAFASTNSYYVERLGRAGNPERGQTLFTQKGCSDCHKLGSDSIGPDLTSYGSGTSLLELAQAMVNHSPAMQEEMDSRLHARPHFRTGEMADLLSYLASQSLPEPAPVYIEPGSPRRGAKVFRDHGCIKCHAFRGEGGERGPDLGTHPKDVIQDYADVAAVMWNHAVPMRNELESAGIDLPDLKGSDLADVIAYIFFMNDANSHGDATVGKQLFDEKGCAACHTSGVAGASPLSFGSTADFMAAMWQNVPSMITASNDRMLAWPTFMPGEMVDLATWVVESSVPSTDDTNNPTSEVKK
ncbi:MAG: c-type cytochrome [Oligoflexia bacterium]|nr:c-type cytochrome [Oligoflexia bacterium]